MGGAVSAGEDNDELVDNLVEAKYIKTSLVERVFRAVDRGNYYLNDHRDNAYKDLAWKHGNLHLSAPCIYSEVMESLDLKPNLSFLNIGSGTGYLSTMIGLVLGPYGINHGIELHTDVVDYSRERLEEFKSDCEVFDEFEFCEPKFVVGNCLLLHGSQLYDRVYCGAACPQEHENFMKNLLNVDGLLVMPVNDQLLQIRRTGETTWESRTVLPVSFASLVIPPRDINTDLIELPEEQAPGLQEACRLTIRRLLRKRIQEQFPNHGVNKRRRPKRRRQLPKPRDRGITMMMLGNMDSESDEEIIHNFPRRALQHSDDELPHSDAENDENNHPSNGRHNNAVDSDPCQCDSDKDNNSTVAQEDTLSMGSSDDFEIAREPSEDGCNGNKKNETTQNAKQSPSNGAPTMDCDTGSALKSKECNSEIDCASNGQKTSQPSNGALKVETTPTSSDEDDFLRSFYADAESCLAPSTQSPEVTSSNHSNRRRRRLYSGKSDPYSSSPGSAGETESGLGMNYSEANSSSDISPSTSADASEGISMNTIEEESSQSDSEPSSARIRLSEILRLRFGGSVLHPRLLLDDNSGDERLQERRDEDVIDDGEPSLPRNLYLTEMLEKIDQLPLPDQLKSYVAYYRNVPPFSDK